MKFPVKLDLKYVTKFVTNKTEVIRFYKIFRYAARIYKILQDHSKIL